MQWIFTLINTFVTYTIIIGLSEPYSQEIFAVVRTGACDRGCSFRASAGESAKGGPELAFRLDGWPVMGPREGEVEGDTAALAKCAEGAG